MKFTPKQQEVITTRNKNILVSAAAGSGKTSVLVERILSMITDKEDPTDIDRFLIVTFTNAAAAEMRERIHARILKGLEEDPENENLQKQSALIHNAQITTIDSYCLFLLRNHFHEIGLDPAFRVGDPGEIKLIEKEVLEKTLESFYAEADEEFLFFTQAYCPDGKDGAVEALVEGLYRFSMSHPWPTRWLAECEKRIDELDINTVLHTEWMQYGLSLACEKIKSALALAESALRLCEEADGPYMYAAAVESDITMLQEMALQAENCEESASYDAMAAKLQKPVWARLSAKKDETVSEEAKNLVKKMRDRYKALVSEVAAETFAEDSLENVVAREKEAGRLERMLLKITARYIDDLTAVKKEKNVLDFSDMEHYALRILVKDGEPTDTAKIYRDYYKAVMIDEYQDSNMVQELILSAVSTQESGKCNRFMVGDMKQSIYRFRMARPEIFMEKYRTYKEESEDNALICLKQNFRSRNQVLDSTNTIFKQIMVPQIGGVVYDDEAALYPGAEYAPADGCETELCLAVTDKGNSEERRTAEAYMIADKIRYLMANFKVGERPLEYRDIVILLRSGSGVDEKLKEILISEGIPAYVTLKAGYFSAMEVSQLMDLLRVMNNPYVDVAFCSVATSMFFGITDEELAWITAVCERGMSLYERFVAVADGEEIGDLPEAIVEKVRAMLKQLEILREEAVVCSMTELVRIILSRFHYVEYVSALPAGGQRKANVEMFVQKTIDFEKTSFHGLFHFLRYMEQLKKYEVDFGEAATLTETADVVRIMTIHKSKGLEFPVCFVAGLDKKYNLKDTADPILLDADWGVAANCIRPKLRTTGKTMRKLTFARKMKRDSLGEELRVLYVAMTRAKEKLILTGAVGEEIDTELLRAETEALCLAAQELPIDVIERCPGALEHIVKAWIRKPDCLKLTQVDEQDLQRKQIRYLSGKMIREERVRMLADVCENCPGEEESAKAEELTKRFSYEYPHEILAHLYTKTSVSELKHAAIEEEGIPVMFETEQKQEEYLPAFARGKEIVHEGAARGSAMHRVLELLDFSAYARRNAEEISVCLEKDIEYFVQEGRLSEEYEKLILKDKIAGFLQSGLARRMAAAQQQRRLFKEQPFVLSVSANLLKEEFPETEKVLIQGIVDVYFEEENELVIVDYKTDRISSLQELKERYKTQLDYYEEAISRLTGKKVKEKILYSFAMMDSICWS